MDFVATFDQPMIHQWTMQYPAIQNHLTAMQENLPDPYRQARLPKVDVPKNIKWEV